MVAWSCAAAVGLSIAGWSAGRAVGTGEQAEPHRFTLIEVKRKPRGETVVVPQAEPIPSAPP
jgi:hypothetical protein